MRVIIRYAVEVDGLPVYTETYDVEKLRDELKEDEQRVANDWLRRIKCVVDCRDRHGFSSCVTRCLSDGMACNCGHEACESVDDGR